MVMNVVIMSNVEDWFRRTAASSGHTLSLIRPASFPPTETQIKMAQNLKTPPSRALILPFIFSYQFQRLCFPPANFEKQSVIIRVFSPKVPSSCALILPASFASHINRNWE